MGSDRRRRHPLVKPVVISLDRENLQVVQDAVQNGRRQSMIGKQFRPLADSFVRGQNQTRPFISGRNDLEQIVGIGPVQ